MTQRPLVPPSPAAAMQLRPYGDADGAVIAHAGRYSRECVLLAFEMIGGVERMAHWADRNPTEFYTRLFSKVITREVEVSAGTGIEDLLAQLDKGGHVVGPTLDAEYEIDE
jgi:hypothetical protein